MAASGCLHQTCRACNLNSNVATKLLNRPKLCQRVRSPATSRFMTADMPGTETALGQFSALALSHPHLKVYPLSGHCIHSSTSHPFCGSIKQLFNYYNLLQWYFQDHRTNHNQMSRSTPTPLLGYIYHSYSMTNGVLHTLLSK